MIWVTGDKHGELSAMKLPGFHKIKKRDTLLVCGDFGFVWDGSKQELKKRKKLSKRRYTIAFVDGCNENFELLEAFDTVDFCGGKAKQIAKNIYWLLRGEIYDIDGKKVLAFGGGSPLGGGVGSAVTQPNTQQIETVVQHLEECDQTVDLIVTHEPPFAVLGCMEDPGNSSLIHDILEEIRVHCRFKQWFFGKYHLDKRIPPFYQAVYDRVIPFE